ncbi:MAG: dockerin type I repeat-containing protein [Pyrinomonadaceae bacterium]
MKGLFHSFVALLLLSALFAVGRFSTAQLIYEDAAGPTATPTCTPANIILDGGFETGGIPSAIWNNPQTSTNFVTPLCDEATCGTGSGASPPRTGLLWAWFGGIPLPETSALGQDVTIPTGTASLHFWMRIGTVTEPLTDVLNVKIDNIIVQSYPEPPTAETVYTERVIDLSAFADGASHNIRFEYIGPSNGTGSYVVDDVTLLASGAGCASPTATPTFTPTASPAPSCTPAERLSDGTFETGNPWSQWTVQTSTNFGTPICDTPFCGTDAGTAPPFSGDNWIWFGGIAAAETATIGQNVMIPSGGPATLTFQLRIGKVIMPFTDTLTVTIDGTNITTFTEPTVAETNYTLRSFDVSAFANGASHALLFTYTGVTTGKANFTVDNVSLIAGGACSTPTITGTIIYGNTITGPPPPFVSNVLLSGSGSIPVSALTIFPGGTYTLSGFGSGAYTVTPTKTGGVNGAISSFDAARISQHSVGIPPGLNATQLIVADVSGNGMVTSFDAGQVARYVTSTSGSGSTGNWIFSPLNRTYPSVTGNIAGQDYTALLMGEVSGNWSNSQFSLRGRNAISASRLER